MRRGKKEPTPLPYGAYLPPSRKPPSLARTLGLIAKRGRVHAVWRRDAQRQRRRGLRPPPEPAPPKPLSVPMRGLNVMDEGVGAIIDGLTANHVPCRLLDLSMCGLTCTGATKVAEFISSSPLARALTAINLQGNRIKDEGGTAVAAALTNNESITSIRLENNDMETAACYALAKALRHNVHAFQELSLYANPIGDLGITPIAHALSSNRPRVRSVLLKRCNISCKGAKALATALRTNNTITNLDLSHNNIADEGAKAIALALTDDNRSVRILDLRANLIENLGMEELEHMINHNRGVRQLLIADNLYAGDPDLLDKRLQRVMDLNEIGYWRIVEAEIQAERAAKAARVEADAAAAVERELRAQAGLNK